MAFSEGTSAKTNDFLRWLDVDGEDGTEFIDHWDTGELLFLASSVLRSDRNWISVSRSIKPFGEQSRPNEWYTPKNCALQYSKLLSEIEEESKKLPLPRKEKETPEVKLVMTLTQKRLNELARLSQQAKGTANVLKTYIDLVEGGEFDDRLDDLLKQMEEQEKTDEENYKEYLTRRETLNNDKKLNKCQIAKGKAPSKGIDSKKKVSSPFPELSDDSSHHSILNEVIKRELVKETETDIKIEVDYEKLDKGVAQLTLNALLDSKVTTASESPLLTSLLRSIASTPSGSQTPSSVSSPLKEVEAESPSLQAGSSSEQKIDVFLSPSKLPPAGISPLLTSLLKSAALPSHSTSLASKESDTMEDNSKSDLDLAAKSREASPRSSVPPSPRTPLTSSPMLNSLLKNSPSSTTSVQLSPAKEISPKALSSPQPFFNPTSALATAAAQQLAVATSTISSSLQFFQQHDLSENRKTLLQSSPVTSACLAAPTLSKLLEMPPSTPGRLPPLPVLDPPVTSTPLTISSIKTEPSMKPISTPVLEITKPPFLESPSKKTAQKTVESSFFPDSTVLQKSSTSYSLADRKGVVVVTTSGEEAKQSPANDKAPYKSSASQKSASIILEEVTESFNQAFDKVKVKLEVIEEEDAAQQVVLDTASQATQSISSFTPVTIKTEKIVSEQKTSTSNNPDHPLSFPDTLKQKVTSSPIDKTSPESFPCSTPPVQESVTVKTSDALEDDKGMGGRKFYKSRIGIKKEILLEKTSDIPPSFQSPKKVVQVKIEPASPTSVFTSEDIETVDTKETLKSIVEKPEEPKPIKVEDSKSPVSKKPRLHERSSTEKIELSEDDIPTAVRRSGRRGKKGRGRTSKCTPVKPEPKDQYEFEESTEENSVGYQATNSLCYMPRSKEDSRSEDSKTKPTTAPDSEDVASNTSSPTEKKISTPLRSKQGRTAAQAATVRKTLFTSDEERMSDSLTSADEASNHLLSEDKLKKWEETCEKKGDIAKNATESLRRTSKVTDLPKKKSLPTKRNSNAKTTPGRKERKLSALDMEDLSACSRDSEMSPAQEKDIMDEKDLIPISSVDMEVETNDSQPSSSIAAESDKQMDDMEESLQGSITTDFSPPATAEIKEEKETPHFGKQDWFQGVSPKSSEAVSQSSEESEDDESDNWDNQSVSTNKSASQSAGTQPRSKRKERETPQYKAWKKAISIVLREASCHKNANVFLQKVTNDVAPGYSSIVHRPMDLSLMKKNIDNGIVRTTEEFHRDMLLMFQNAIMYNSSDHDVHQMAVEMQRDVVEQISAFIKTQSNDKGEINEPRGGRNAKSQKGKQAANTLKVKEEVD